MMRLVLTSLAALSLMACAPEAEKKAPAPTTQAEKTSTSGSVVPCSGADASGAPTFESNTTLDGNVSYFMSAFKGGEKQSLCSILSASGKEVALFQFVGVACVSCKDEAKDVTTRINASAEGAKMQHYIVFVDGEDTGVDASWFQSFVNDNTAGAAIAKFEPEKTLMRRYNGDPSGLQFGSAVAINRYGQAFYIPGIAGIPEIISKAEQLAP